MTGNNWMWVVSAAALGCVSCLSVWPLNVVLMCMAITVAIFAGVEA